MEENFDPRTLLDPDTLDSLQRRRNTPSLVRLTLHMGAFAAAVSLVITIADRPLLALCASVGLAAIWASLFAPFHECTHNTAFRTRQLNTVGAWLTGIPFGMAPAFYRAIHFQHHRYTHDARRDPELLGVLQPRKWPTTRLAWLSMISGMWFLRLKATALVGVCKGVFKPGKSILPWASTVQSSRIIKETLVVAATWSAAAIAAALWAHGAAWLLFSLLLSHLFQATWLTTEHTGLKHEGTILERTRTMHTSALVRWWLWNMNFHAEHHGWPAVPWFKLPELHRRIAEHLEHQACGYWRLQLDVLKQRALPDGVSMSEARN
jgi:fatty acid desaturase